MGHENMEYTEYIKELSIKIAEDITNMVERGIVLDREVIRQKIIEYDKNKFLTNAEIDELSEKMLKNIEEIKNSEEYNKGSGLMIAKAVKGGPGIEKIFSYLKNLIDDLISRSKKNDAANNTNNNDDDKGHHSFGRSGNWWFKSNNNS